MNDFYMVNRNYNMNSSQFEFMKNNGDIEYHRKGGCFVTTPKAIIYLVITAVALVLTGLFVYYYSPNQMNSTASNKPQDIEKLLNISLENIPKQDIRLPKNLKPFHYKLYLEPAVDEVNKSFSLKGKVTIFMECKTKTKNIVLNWNGFKIDAVEVAEVQKNNRTKRSVPEEELTSTTVTESATESIVSSANHSATTERTTTIGSAQKSNQKNETEKNYKAADDKEQNSKSGNELKIKNRAGDTLNLKYTVQMQKDLTPTKNYSIKIDFSMNITENFQGIYPAHYMNGNQKTWLLATHFQPIYARELFPCFDEPSFKAPIQVTIKKPQNQTVISSYPLMSSHQNGSDSAWDRFQATRPIPTYLFGFLIAELEIVATVEAEPKVQIWASRNFEIKTDYAADVIQKILIYLEQYFEIKYPFPKLDIVAVRNLPMLSTKSSGLFLIKESLFLDSSQNQVLFEVLAKDLAQEWFGGLVSIDWWNDYWMVEGFSIFLGKELIAEVEKRSSEFPLHVTQKTLYADDFKSVQNLKVSVENNLQIIEVSDNFKHSKGSCLLRMLNYSLAPITFRKGIQLYLRDHFDQSSDSDGLWKSIDLAITAIDKLPGKTVYEIMQTWTSQTGYPLITISKNLTSGGIEINQTKFQSNGNDNSLWIVPLTFVTGEDDGQHTLWLTERSVSINNISKSYTNETWLLFNVGQTGYYRVNYGISNWNLLINVLKSNFSKIPVPNRGQLINDAFELAEKGVLNYKIPFDLSQYLIKETNFVPWASVLNGFDFIKSILRTTYLNGAYEDYITNLVSKLFDSLGPEDKTDDTQNDKELRKLIVNTACSVNYEKCTRWASEQMKKWMEDPSRIIPSNYKETVLCTGIKLGGRSEWNFVFQRLRSEESSADVKDLYASLGCTKQHWLVNRYLQATLNGTIDWQYVPFVWQSLRDVPAIGFAFKFLRENWDKIYTAYKDQKLVLKTIIMDFLFSLSTKSDLEDLTLFFSKHEKELQDFSHMVQGAVDRIKARVEWANNYLDIIDSWLSSNNYK